MKLNSPVGLRHGIRAMMISGRGKHFTGGVDLAAFSSIAELLKNQPGRSSYILRAFIKYLQK